MITITKERLLKIKQWRETYGPGSNVVLPAEEAEELARIALASLTAEPVGFAFADDLDLMRKKTKIGGMLTVRYHGDMPVYTAPPAPVDNTFIPKNLDKALGVVGVALPESKEEFNFQIERWIQRLIDRVIRYADEFKEQPAPVVPEELAKAFISAIEKEQDRLFDEDYLMDSKDCIDVIREEALRLSTCRGAMLQGAEPVSNRDELAKLIEGMEVSVDVSTCDADAGHRYFGTVTEVSELNTAKHGLILLVQDAKPNFKHTGNSSVIPDGYVLVPIDPTEDMIAAAMNCEDVLFNSDESFCVQFGNIYAAMIAAAPQQEVKTLVTKAAMLQG